MEKERLVFPNAQGGIEQNENAFWSWWAAFSDGSGKKIGWCPTKRGAKICVIHEARHFSRNYQNNVRYHWEKITQKGN